MGMIGEGNSLPPEALKELERFYGFDKPIYQRYFIWLGVFPKANIELYCGPSKNLLLKRVGKRWADLESRYKKTKMIICGSLYEKNGLESDIWYARVDEIDSG